MINYFEIAKISYNKNKIPNSAPFEELSEEFQRVLIDITQQVIEGYLEYSKNE